MHVLSVPCRPGTPTCRLWDKTRSSARIHALPCALQLWTLPPAEVGSGAVTCSTALDPAPCRDGLWRCHVPYGSRPRFPIELGSDAATCLTAPDPASQSRWALTLPHVQWLWTSPLGWCGLRYHHMSHEFAPCFPAKKASGVDACPTALDPASLPGWAMSLVYKERHSRPTYTARLVCFQGTLARFEGAWRLIHYDLQNVRTGGAIMTSKTCGLAATVQHPPGWPLTRHSYSARRPDRTSPYR
jgi:hypothetical protein